MTAISTKEFLTKLTNDGLNVSYADIKRLKNFGVIKVIKFKDSYYVKENANYADILPTIKEIIEG